MAEKAIFFKEAGGWNPIFSTATAVFLHSTCTLGKSSAGKKSIRRQKNVIGFGKQTEDILRCYALPEVAFSGYLPSNKWSKELDKQINGALAGTFRRINSSTKIWSRT